jgi:beta-lactamase superfamily II metal-dependent hydrolase
MAYEDIPFEVDLFPVGNKGGSGDAIVVRFGDLNGPRDRQHIVVIDGGFTDDGEAIVKFVRDTYSTDYVDLVVSTHPDQDHITGLCTVVEDLTVGGLLLHLPWDHTTDIAELFHDGRVTDNSVGTKLRDELNGARILAEAALERDVKIHEPFAGMSAFDGRLKIVGPSREYYESLILDFRCTPEPVRGSGVLLKAGELAHRVAERFDIETLTDEGDTSAENQSSVVTLFDFGSQTVLLTGDAGIEALELAADHLDDAGYSSPDVLQVPHHGSKHNVGPTVLDRLVGPRFSRDEQRSVALVSAAPDGAPRHPARQVTNALRRRGAYPFATRGKQLRHGHLAPPRLGWTSAEPIPFYPEVEE